MYSKEIHKYIERRNYRLTPEETWFITDHRQHPQIDHVKYENDWYHMWTNDGYQWVFKCKEYEPKKKVLKRD